jgi:hypothetical protein
MAIKKYFQPFTRETELDFVAKTMNPNDVKSLGKTFKIAALALGYQGTNYFYTGRSNFEPSPYDFDRIIQAVDTDSYVKQAVQKYKDLFWKEGWKITSENQEAVSYLYQRIDYMEMAMKKPFLDFLIELSDQLIKFGNVFIVKARGDLNQYFPSKLTPIGETNTMPVTGYYLIPTEQVRILRDKYNRPKSYMQQTDPLTYAPTDRDPVWSADRVIHLYFDRKPGRAFGTPFLSNVLDDVVALRQMEEDIQNLVHRELFPLYKYIIGTADQPAEPEEIERAASEIENLRSEGGLILPYRHDVDVIGSAKEALDSDPYLQHFKERVAIGLGVAPHHLGMTLNGGNRSMTERLDTSLYDKVKQFQRQFSEMIRLHIFNELLFEGGFDPIQNPMEPDTSERCFFQFNEIDVDTQVKKETHVMQKYVNSLITLSEARLELGLNPEAQIDDLFTGIQASMQKDLIDSQQQAQDANSDNQQPAKSGERNLPSKRRGVGNATRPQNQSGRRTSPNIKRSDNSWINMVENLLEEQYHVKIENIDNKDKSEE